MLVYPMMARPFGRSPNMTGHVIMCAMLKAVRKLLLPLEGPALFKGKVENVFWGWNWYGCGGFLSLGGHSFFVSFKWDFFK